MFFTYHIQYPSKMEPMAPPYPEREQVDKWFSIEMLNRQAIRKTTPVYLMPFLFRDEKLPPETVNLDKWYFEGMLFSPRINPIVRQQHYLFQANIRCPSFEFNIKHPTSYTYPAKNITAYTYPTKKTTVYTFPRKNVPC